MTVSVAVCVRVCVVVCVTGSVVVFVVFGLRSKSAPTPNPTPTTPTAPSAPAHFSTPRLETSLLVLLGEFDKTNSTFNSETSSADNISFVPKNFRMLHP